jgi:hypothetical protein
VSVEHEDNTIPNQVNPPATQAQQDKLTQPLTHFVRKLRVESECRGGTGQGLPNRKRLRKLERSKDSSAPKNTRSHHQLPLFIDQLSSSIVFTTSSDCTSYSDGPGEIPPPAKARRLYAGASG